MTESGHNAPADSQSVSRRSQTSRGWSQLVLSLFPGIDLLGRGFEAEGFCIVRGPDLLWGGHIETFHAPPGRFDGVLAGTPCQDFSRKRRTPPTGDGVRLLNEFARVVTEAKPEWWLLENVPTVPNVSIDGYRVQRFDLSARECGLRQSRLRHFQFGSRSGRSLVLERQHPEGHTEPICLASEGKRTLRRTFADFCELQGLPREFDLPGYSRAGKYQAVGNGVPIPMARVIARSIRFPAPSHVLLCVCDCGRTVTGRQKSATPACRKRLQRRREAVQ